ncbi:MAG: hypothetical protein Q7U12_11715 [Undibacterium sp.]|nr:hypothetical protein [Undibacterium sp.]
MAGAKCLERSGLISSSTDWQFSLQEGLPLSAYPAMDVYEVAHFSQTFCRNSNLISPGCLKKRMEYARWPSIKENLMPGGPALGFLCEPIYGWLDAGLD